MDEKEKIDTLLEFAKLLNYEEKYFLAECMLREAIQILNNLTDKQHGTRTTNN